MSKIRLLMRAAADGRYRVFTHDKWRLISKDLAMVYVSDHTVTFVHVIDLPEELQLVAKEST